MTRSNNLVSVIIPMYNAQDSIIRCLESVLKQTYQGGMEIIVVNDGSEDQSQQMVTGFAQKHPFYSIQLINQKNGGVSKARNAGLRIATGDFIALLDSDDEWFGNKIEIQMIFFKSFTQIDFLGALIHKPTRMIVNDILLINLKNLIFKNYFQPSTVIFKRKVLDTIGYFEETQKYAEEGNYFMRVANQFNCGLVNKQLVLYDQGKQGFGQSGLSANLLEMEKGELRNLKFAYNNKFISLVKYVFAVFFSVFKYLRRIIIVKLVK
jgi:glycosyltransferase involved in cell wall biosynthesis